VIIESSLSQIRVIFKIIQMYWLHRR